MLLCGIQKQQHETTLLSSSCARIASLLTTCSTSSGKKMCRRLKAKPSPYVLKHYLYVSKRGRRPLLRFVLLFCCSASLVFFLCAIACFVLTLLSLLMAVLCCSKGQFNKDYDRLLTKKSLLRFMLVSGNATPRDVPLSAQHLQYASCFSLCMCVCLFVLHSLSLPPPTHILSLCLC